MSVLKLSKNDIRRNEDKEEKIKLKRSDLSYDSTMVSGWEQTNLQAIDILNDYNNRINKSEWLDEEDRKTYKKALDSYIETANLLRGINKTFGEGYSDEDEKKWNDSIASMNEAYASTEKYYSQWIDEKDYKGQRNGYFQKSNLFDDGYQFGDITKTIGATITDAAQHVGEGIVGMGEAALDGLMTIAPYIAQGQYYSNGGGYNLQADRAFDLSIETSKKGVSEFVAKDLYNEEAIAKAIIAEPVKAITGIDAVTDSVFGEKMDSLATSGGQMLGKAGLQMVGVPWQLTTAATVLGGEAENALRQGGALDEAAFSGLVSAGGEVLTEMIGGISFGSKTLADLLPLEELTAKISIKAVRKLADLGIDMLAEGGEEILSGFISAIGQKLSYESDKKLFGELLTSEETLDSFIGGALLAFVGAPAQYVAQKNAKNKQASEIYGNGAELVTEALDIDPSNAFAQKMQAKLDKGKSLSGGQINRLVKANENAIVSQDKVKMKAAVEARLTELGEEGEIGKLADAIVKGQSGDNLTPSEIAMIANSKYGIRVSNELTPESIESGEHTSKWAENIGTDRINAEAYNRAVDAYPGKAENAPVTENTPVKENSTEATFEATVVVKNAEGKTVNTEIQGVEVDGDKVSFTLANGEKVERGSVAFKSDNAQMVADIAVDKVSRVNGFSNEAATAMIKGYDGSISPTQYTMAFDDAFKMGASGVPSSKLIGVINSGVSDSTAYAAYELGRQSAKKVESVLKSVSKNGIIEINGTEAENESGENVHLRNGGKRDGGKNTQRQVSRMEGSAGQAESRGKTARIADSEAARLVNEGREVKVSDLGILGGSKEQTVRLVDKANETSSMKEARKSAEARGLKVTFFVGDNLVINDKSGEWISARAYIKGNHVFVRADHSLYTADQLMQHELGHDMIAKGEVDIDAVRERLEKTVGKENIDAVAKHYADAYAGTGMSAQEIWEECICDSLGDMNIFAGVEATGTFLDLMLAEIKAVASESKSPTQTRGSPDAKTSRETYTKTQYNNFGWVRANDVVSEGYWDNFTRNYADAVYNKGFDRITPDGEYMIEVYDQNLEERLQVIDHIVFAKGSIKSPNVTRIIQIYEVDEAKLDKYRGNIYDFERRGIPQETGELLELHRKTDFGAYDQEGYGRDVSRYNQQLGTERGGSSKSASRVKEYIFEVEESEVSGKASRELDTDSTEYKIKTSMTMAEAKRMIETAYKVNNIAEYYEGEYANAEDWLKKAGPDEVEMYIENDFDLQEKYINSNEDILNEEYRISDVLDAYLAGTLIGKEKPKPKRLDVSQSTKLEDDRFYSPQKIEDAKATFELAKQKAVGRDANVINRARAEILLFAHNKGAAELLGVTQAELNKKLRSWSNYSATARNISERINAGVAEENRWTGIENSSYISKAKVTNEDIERLVASVEGDSKGYERKYIARVMLAADTHIDYSGLKFKFASSQQVNADNNSGGNSGGRVLGFYDDANRQIEVTHDKPNTVAHEMGHYIDAQWGRELVGSTSSHLFLSRGVNADIVRERYGEPGVQFLNNFKLFINSLSDVNQTYNSYYNDRGEIFARFFAKFIEWTDNIATGNKYYSSESTMYGDKFTQAQYVEFARLLQEKALLDGTAKENSQQGKASRELDTEYLSAVNRGDTEAAQKMVDEAAKKAGYTVKAYHGTDDSFTVFDKKKIGTKTDYGWFGRGFYFHIDADTAKIYGKNNMGAYLKIDKLLDLNTETRDDEGFDDAMDRLMGTKHKDNESRSKDFTKWLIENGYDGVAAWGQRMVLNSNQIKSADPVTYDDKGEVIPLSERFNPKNIDIRYSRELDFIDFINEQAGEESDPNLTKTQQVAKVRGELEKMNVGKGEVMAVMSLSDKMFEVYGGDSSISDFRYGLFEATKLALNGSETGFEAAYEIIHTLAREVAYNPKDVGGEAELLAEIKREIKGSRLAVHEADKTSGEFDSYGGYGAFRKSHLGKFMLANDGIQVDVKYEELQNLYGKSFFPDVNTVSEQLMQMAKLMDTPLSDYMMVSEEELDATADEMVNSLFVKLGDIWGRAINSVKTIVASIESDKFSNRSLLVGALETAVQNDIERNKLEQYKEKIALINSEEQKLLELRTKIKELSFKKGPRDTEAIRKLQFEANQAANRINTYDKQLLNLESTKALKGVLEREKALARKRDAQKYKEAIDRYRERSAKAQRELMDRYQESRKRATEGRNKTAMRHKIKGIVSELNTLLLKPTAKKHIKEELRKEVADALSAINMDTIGADERVAMYNDLIAKETNPDVIAELTKTRDRIQLQGENLREKLNNLQMAYEKIKNTEDIELNLAYQEVIRNSIQAVSEKVGKTSIRNMTLEQLEMVYGLFTMIHTTIRDANKAFKTKKGETITQMAEAVNDQVRTVGGQPYKRNAISAEIQRAGWTFLKPYVAFRTIGSVTFTNMYKELRNGEDTFYTDVKEAQAFIEEQYKRHGYKTWDMKKTKTFTAKSGKTFDLTLEQMMSLYAYYQRPQAHKHVMEGGIVFEDAVITEKNKLGVPIKYEVTTKDAFNLSEDTFKGICEYLEENHKDVVAFVKEMQAYLSDTMGAKGNEVSMELLGVKLFKEKFYLPIKSSQYYMNFKAEEAGEVKLKSPAFSKETVPHANNPIVIHNFTDLWSEHINDMAMYHSFVLALEDFTRVYNYKTKTDAKVETMDTKATLETAYPGVTQYINKFLKDMNGGVRAETVGWAEKLTSLSKKGAVLGSASVTIQQPSAVMRAMAYINPQYFITTAHQSINLAKHKADWAELKQYAPIAGIKEMGRFDVGMGQATVDWIQSNKTVLEKAEDILSLPPALMDEITWVSIWNAVKRETLHNNKSLSPTSEEFLKLAGERFTEVISLSQVYDSVFSRSDLMRNKSWIAKSLTAFMAEPSTTLNMIWDSWVEAKRTGGFKAYAKATVTTGGPIVSGIILNSVLKSIILALRDDDEDESYVEKYLEHFVGDLKDSLNPLSLIPFVKDIVSIFNGYDVERMDMALFSDLKKAIDAMDSDSKTLYEKWSGLIGAISAFFGVPVKNVERDVRALINTVFGETEETTVAGMLIAVKEGWTGKEISNGQQLYEAIIKGDSAQIERIKSRFEDQNDIEAAIRKALRDNDPRVRKAAEAFLNGDVATYNKLREEIIAEGNFSWEIVTDALKAEYNYLKNKAKED